MEPLPIKKISLLALSLSALILFLLRATASVFYAGSNQYASDASHHESYADSFSVTIPPDPRPAAHQAEVVSQRAVFQDFMAFLLQTSQPDVPEYVRQEAIKATIGSAASEFSDVETMRLYLLSASRRLRLEGKLVGKKLDYSLRFFESSLAADLSKLCHSPFTINSLKSDQAQLQASACYFKALSEAEKSDIVAAKLYDHGGQIPRLLRRQKDLAKTSKGVKGGGLNAKQNTAELSSTVESGDSISSPSFPRPISNNLADTDAVKAIYGIDSDQRTSDVFHYSLAKIAKSTTLSPTRSAVMAASISQAALSVLQTNEEAKQFVDVLGAVSGYQSGHLDGKTHGSGLGGLTIALADFAARSCGLSTMVTQQDIDSEQSNLLLSACLYGETLRRFGQDPLLSGAAYQALVSFGSPVLASAGNPVVNRYTLSTLTEVLHPFQGGEEVARAESLVNAVAGIVKSPLESLNRTTTFHLLARIAVAMNPGDEKAQKNWLIVLAMESKFDGRPHSETGARGIGQLIPSYVHDFGLSCGLTNVHASDVADDATNALLSACYFKKLVTQYNGLVTVALAAYNAGLHSNDVHNFKRLSSMSNEPANYVAKYSLIKEALDMELERGSSPSLVLSSAGDDEDGYGEPAGRDAPPRSYYASTLRGLTRASGLRASVSIDSGSAHPGPRVAWLHEAHLAPRQ